MIARMQHPQHGWMHAYSDSEIAYLRGLGWDVEQDPIEAIESAKEDVKTAIADLQAPRKKPGPKPKAK